MQIEDFLALHGWDKAVRNPLQGDASARSYIRLYSGTNRAILMIDPQDDTERFSQLSKHLNAVGLSAPEIYARAQGLLLLEDFGDGRFADVITKKPSEELPLYRAATNVLVHLETTPLIDDLTEATPGVLGEMIAPFFSHYLPALCGSVNEGSFDDAKKLMSDCLEKYLPGERILVLRDHHAENMMWLPEREGVRRVGLLDFQDAISGPPIYDLVSMLQDARRDLTAECVERTLEYYARTSGRHLDDVLPAYHLLGLQRNLRVLGIFVRLAVEKKKTAYVELLPRVWAHVQSNLFAAVAEPLRNLLEDKIPEPTPNRLKRIYDQCQTQ